MHCPSCGIRNDDAANFCGNCGYDLAPEAQDQDLEYPLYEDNAEDFEHVPNYLVWSILVTIWCFPLGIAATIFSAQVNGKIASGDLSGAVSASQTAKTLCWTAFYVGAAAIFAFGVILQIVTSLLP